MDSPQGTHEERARANVDDVNKLANARPVRIGIITPLTGPGDPTAGELIVRGACLGAEYVHERGMRPVEFVLANDQATAVTEGMAKSAAAQMTKLALVDNVAAVIGQWQLRTTPWVVDVATRYSVPIFIENGHNHVTMQKRRNVFRSYFTITDRVPLMLDFAAAQGMRRIGMLSGDTVFGQMTADSLEDYGRTKHEMDFLRFNFAQDGDHDFTEPLKAIREYQPDLFINGGLILSNYRMMKQAAEFGILPATPMMVTFGFPLRSEDFWRQAGELGVGTMWPATRYRPSWEGMTAMGHWFIDHYRERYDSFPPDTALTHFNDVVTIVSAVEAARSDDREDILDALEAMEFQTWRGPIRYERGPAHWHHSSPEVVLLQYQRFGQSFDDSAIIYPPETATAEYLPPSGD